MTQEIIFCGENRKAALAQFVAAYDTVAASARARLADAKGPPPAHRVVLIHAERGLGKTRLAMELYRHLTTADDPQHYWPDDYDRLAERVAVTPHPEDCNFAARPRFLWWGIQIDDGHRPGNPVLDALGALLPHLTTVRLATRRREAVRDIAAELADVAAEIGIEHGKEFVFEAAAGLLGPIKAFGTAAWKIGRVLHGQIKEEQDPRSHAERHVESIVDAVLDDLARLFDPGSRNYAGAPLVLLVDDAQFAGRADAIDRFLARLIGRATHDRWPLLLLLTHWSRDLTAWTDAAGQEHPPSSVAGILHHARHGDGRDPGLHGIGGGSLWQRSFLVIDLGSPVDDLAPALRDRFPGLAPATVEQVLALVDGNPRKIEQIMARMDRRPVWFEGRNRDGDLTPEGLAAVLALSELRIDEIVYERFRDTPEDVRRALTLAGLIGHRFLVDLVDRLSAARLAGPAQPGLAEAERTFRMLRDVVDRSQDVPSAFAERLFHQASTTYRVSGEAGADLAGWPDDAALDAALEALLRELVEHPGRFEGLRPGEGAHALGLAAERLLARGDPAAGLALARLVSVENVRGNHEGAATAALRFAGGFPESWTLDGIPVDLWDEAAITLMNAGQRDHAERIWRALHTSLAERAALDPDNVEWQHNLSINHNRTGDVEMARGAHDAAFEAYRAGLGIVERLAALDPGNVERQRDLALSHDRIGNVEMARGARDAALKAHQAAFVLAERLVALDPDNARWQRDLSISHNRIGDVEMARGAHDAALKAYQAAFDIRARLAALDPDNAGWQRGFAVSHSKIGDVEMALGAREAARATYRAGLGIVERLAALDPGNVERQRDLIVSRVKLAEAGERPEENYRAALAIARGLAGSGRLAPADGRMVAELERRLAALGPGGTASG